MGPYSRPVVSDPTACRGDCARRARAGGGHDGSAAGASRCDAQTVGRRVGGRAKPDRPRCRAEGRIGAGYLGDAAGNAPSPILYCVKGLDRMATKAATAAETTET